MSYTTAVVKNADVNGGTGKTQEKVNKKIS